MWLINASNLELEYVQDAGQHEYAILSHTWCQESSKTFMIGPGTLVDVSELREEEEVTFQDMKLPRDRIQDKKGFRKIQSCCKQALRDGYQYAWVDTCCIDKSSSAELSEAINSMFSWYSRAATCYVYLSDVDWFKAWWDVPFCTAHLQHSRWFSRGWTLQELLAPTHVQFYAACWTALASKIEMCEAISTATGISNQALLGRPLNDFNVGERMSWASKRSTTRIEDTSYALLGIFGVNMPLLYGEGENAFKRLQEQILSSTEDYSIFAWQAHRAFDAEGLSVLATSPRNFDIANKDQWKYSELSSQTDPEGFWHENAVVQLDPPMMTPRGIRMSLLTFQHLNGTMAMLCRIKGESRQESRWLCAFMTKEMKDSKPYYRSNAPLHVCTVTSSWPSPRVTHLYGARDPKEPSTWRAHALVRACGTLRRFSELRQDAANIVAIKLANGHAYYRHKMTSQVSSHFTSNAEFSTLVTSGAAQQKNESFGPNLASNQSIRLKHHQRSGVVAKDLDFTRPAEHRGITAQSPPTNVVQCEGLHGRSLELLAIIRQLSAQSIGDREYTLPSILLCCFLAFAEGHQVMYSEFGEGRWHDRTAVYISGIVPELYACNTIAEVVIKLATFPPQRLDIETLMMQVRALQSCMAFAQKDHRDRFALQVAQAAFRKRAEELFGATGGVLSGAAKEHVEWAVEALVDADGVAREFDSFILRRPSLDNEKEFVTWAWHVARSWSQYPAMLFSMLRNLCSSIQRDQESSEATERENIAMLLEGLILRKYSLASAGRSNNPLRRHLTPQSLAWVKIVEYIINDQSMR